MEQGSDGPSVLMSNTLKSRRTMHLTHKIALLPTSGQADYFARACGTARMVWNWALDEWNRQYALGRIPRIMVLKKRFNAIKYKRFPWLKDIHRDAHAQPFLQLSRTVGRFFEDKSAGRPTQAPQFRRKGRCTDSFYVANDKFSLSGQSIRLPKVGEIAMREKLRFTGKILGATVSRQAGRWYVAVRVDVPETEYFRRRTGHQVVGVDLGSEEAATLSNGEIISSPKSLKTALRRARIREKRLRRKVEAAKATAGFKPKTPLPPGTHLPVSHNCKKSSLRLARTQVRIANLRADFCHKFTIRLCRENQTVVIEKMPVSGMASRVSSEQIRRQIGYKSKRYGSCLVVDGHGRKNEASTPARRGVDATKNLERFATETALPVASPSGNGGATGGSIPSVVGKVTPVRNDCGRQDTSGQEMKRAHVSESR